MNEKALQLILNLQAKVTLYECISMDILLALKGKPVSFKEYNVESDIVPLIFEHLRESAIKQTTSPSKEDKQEQKI